MEKKKKTKKKTKGPYNSNTVNIYIYIHTQALHFATACTRRPKRAVAIYIEHIIFTVLCNSDTTIDIDLMITMGLWQLTLTSVHLLHHHLQFII